LGKRPQGLKPMINCRDLTRPLKGRSSTFVPAAGMEPTLH
jgi:hypothetical protein